MKRRVMNVWYNGHKNVFSWFITRLKYSNCEMRVKDTLNVFDSCRLSVVVCRFTFSSIFLFSLHLSLCFFIFFSFPMKKAIEFIGVAKYPVQKVSFFLFYLLLLLVSLLPRKLILHRQKLMLTISRLNVEKYYHFLCWLLFNWYFICISIVGFHFTFSSVNFG